MKKIKILIIVFVLLFIANVKADMGAPFVVNHKVKVTNKSGAACYENGKKTGKVIPYGTTFDLSNEIEGTYVYVYVNEGEYSCNIKYSDISAVNQSFSLKNDEVYKLDSAKKAVILAKGGLNMRKGPAVTYGRITTIPQYTVVTATYSAGEYWYYVTYNGQSGWVTGMDNYLGFEAKDILIHHEPLKIYSTNGKTVLGTIPANTEITNYLELSALTRSEFGYYVSYNNINGYIVKHVGHKTTGTGKIKLTEDYEASNKIKIAKGTDLEYTAIYYDINEIDFYIPERKLEVQFLYNQAYEYIKEAKVAKKTSGYIGEGLFGEAKTVKDDEPTTLEPSSETDEPPVIVEEKKDYTNYIIIGLLAGIFACLTALVIIKLVNSKKKAPVVKEAKKEEGKEEKELPKEEPEIKVSDKEILKAREEIAKEVNSTEEENKNKEV